VFAVAHRVEDGLADRPFVEGRDIPDEEAVLVVLLCVAKIDRLPEPVEKGEETLTAPKSPSSPYFETWFWTARRRAMPF
jgi:hypothetical protein